MLPECNSYLVYIFTKMREQPDYVRSVAGLMLKNNIKDHYSNLPTEVKNYIKSEVVSCLGDPLVDIRRTVSSVITTIVVKGSLKNWPNLIHILMQYLDSGDQNAVNGALRTLYVICEDYSDKLDSEEFGRPLNVLIPKFIALLKSEDETFRRYALKCINQFILDMPHALIVQMDAYLQVL
jgi:transportin-1